MPISGKKMANLFRKKGYHLVKKRGKGSHMIMKKGSKTETIPGHKELSKGMEKKFLKILEEVS